ncbi:MAG: sulfotransferase family protein [Myxococcota bacterium]
MKVIGAGFGRTGTRALKSALERLGYGPCYHMSEVINQPQRVRQWFEIASGAPPKWDEVFAGYQSTTDWPAATYWRELAAHYPQAKVILSVRDPERWYESMRATILKSALAERQALPPHRRAIRWLVAKRSPDFALYPRMAKAIITQRIFDDRIDDRNHVIKVFQQHIREVSAAIANERLLVFNVEDGWAPLCDFLGCPIPDEPFIRTNARAAFFRKRPRRLLRLIVLGR